MVAAPPPVIALPRRSGPVTVRLGGLDDDLDALHEGDPLWWGKDWVADRIASTPPDDPWMILVSELDGEPVGSAFILGKGIQAGGCAMSDLFVLPRARRRGAGRALADALADATRAYGLPGYITSASDSDPAVVTVAERLGFAVVGHHHESLLDLDALDLDTATAAVRRAEDAGYRLELIPEEAGEEAWQRAYALCIELFRDAPDAEGATDELPYSVFRGFFPDGSYVLLAWRDGEPVGFTSVMDRAKDDALNTFFTGVTRRARGSGLSTALKAAHALHMRARGHHRLYTQNMDQNAPILAANDRLGFRVDSGFYDLARTVTGD